MKKWYIMLSLCCFSLALHAQQAGDQETGATPADSVVINLDVDFATLQLPPLSVLYANATSNPTVKMLEKEKQLQKKLLAKEKRGWLSFFTARAAYSHGVTDNYGTVTDIMTPIFYQYSGIEQDYWNVGGNVNIPLETLFDLGGKVKRQRILVEKAEYAKEQAYDQLKQQIAHLYVSILSNIETLKRSAEHLALYKGATAVTEQEYRNRRATISELAELKREEFEANRNYENLRATINEQLLVLEIISHTPILTIQNEPTTITEK
ncbi:MAG: TolC family protein [Bacteroidaceae bacterium]|nr:TolC family protein [Bacteroidaceae bacterium]